MKKTFSSVTEWQMKKQMFKPVTSIFTESTCEHCAGDRICQKQQNKWKKMLNSFFVQFTNICRHVMSWPPVCMQAEGCGFQGKYVSFIPKLYPVFSSFKQDIPVAYYCDCSYSVPLWVWPITYWLFICWWKWMAWIGCILGVGRFGGL